MRAPPAAVLFVHDVDRMAAFYRGVFAMRAVLAEPDIAVLELDGFQLTVHRIRGAATDFRGDLADPPRYTGFGEKRGGIGRMGHGATPGRWPGGSG